MQAVSWDSLYEMSYPVLWNKSEKYFKCRPLIFFFFDYATDDCVIIISL